jgi:predicted component of type VI protein secretion system
MTVSRELAKVSSSEQIDVLVSHRLAGLAIQNLNPERFRVCNYVDGNRRARVAAM